MADDSRYNFTYTTVIPLSNLIGDDWREWFYRLYPKEQGVTVVDRERFFIDCIHTLHNRVLETNNNVAGASLFYQYIACHVQQDECVNLVL